MSKEIRPDKSIFRYTKIARNLYFGFRKEKNFFIASPEKALLDALYLMSYGRYTLDIAALDVEKLDIEQIKRLSLEFPQKTREMLSKHGYLKTT